MAELASRTRRKAGSGAGRSRSGIHTSIQWIKWSVLLRLAVSGLAGPPVMMEPAVLSEVQIRRLMCKGGREAVRSRVCNLCMDRYFKREESLLSTLAGFACHVSHLPTHIAFSSWQIIVRNDFARPLAPPPTLVLPPLSTPSPTSPPSPLLHSPPRERMEKVSTGKGR